VESIDFLCVKKVSALASSTVTERLERDPWSTSRALLQDALGDGFAGLFHRILMLLAVVIELPRVRKRCPVYQQ
jgi:hypothetical protein